MLSAHRSFALPVKNQIALAFFPSVSGAGPGPYAAALLGHEQQNRRCHLDAGRKTTGVQATPVVLPYYCIPAPFIAGTLYGEVQKQKGFGISASANVLRSMRYIAFAWILSCQRKRRSTFRSDHHSP